ncbi:hypothetical protein N7676_16040 [Stenotrophomonas sp. GD03993]|uniref:hypothetical protein n=1 Tax=Stenotrophomonas sp. GD03993 TaxID=2975416 RepID=UPI00244ACED3|nr:hypothetical protein [Stenotrophomonas sp. GD03993]MDH0465318.1 hypothetical protein [Stenotrophomonas sp. GD03993]
MRPRSMSALASASTVRIVLQEIHVAGAAGSCRTWRDRCALGEVATDVARAAGAGRAVVLDAGADQRVDQRHRPAGDPRRQSRRQLQDLARLLRPAGGSQRCGPGCRRGRAAALDVGAGQRVDRPHRPAGDPRPAAAGPGAIAAPWARWPPMWPGPQARAGRSCSMPALTSASTSGIGLQEIHVIAAGSCRTWCDRCAPREVANGVARAAGAVNAAALDVGAGQRVDQRHRPAGDPRRRRR